MGSNLSNNYDDKSEANVSTSFASTEIELSWTEAMIIPISASLSLLMLFFFFHYLQYFLLLTVLIGSTTSLFQISRLSGKYFHLAFTRSHGSNKIWVVNTFSIIITVVVVCEWIRSGNFICHDILGCSLCIAFISTVTIGRAYTSYFTYQNQCQHSAPVSISEIGYLLPGRTRHIRYLLGLSIRILFPIKCHGRRYGISSVLIYYILIM